MKNLITFLFLGILASVAFVSCKDDFKEEDFMALQRKERLKQDSILRARNKADVASASAAAVADRIADLNAAGDLMSFSLLVRADNVGLADVDVTLSNADNVSATGRTSAVLTGRTDANGNVSFAKVTIGKSTVSLSKTGFVKATAILDFGTPSAPVQVQTSIVVNGVSQTVSLFYPPAKLAVSGILPLYSKSATGGSTATITGKVTAELDATNKTPEIPQGIIVKANLVGLTIPGTGSGVSIVGYQFDDANFGTATVDNTTGIYSMIVPASAGSQNILLDFPNFTANQRLAVSSVDGTVIATGPEYRNVATLFGPTTAILGSDAMPNIPGAKAVFPTPPAPGAGLNFAPVVRARGLGNWATNVDDGNPNSGGFQSVNLFDPAFFDLGNVAYQMGTRGTTTITASPAITIASGAGTGAVMRASLRGTVGTITPSGGTLYSTGDQVTVELRFTDTPIPPATAVTTTLITVTNVSVTAVGGAITALNLTGTTLESFDPWSTTATGDLGFNVANFVIRLTTTFSPGGGSGAAATVAIGSSEVDHLKMFNGGSGYTGAFTVAFASGGATLFVREFRSQWNLATPTRTTAYPVVPSGASFEHVGMFYGTVLNGNVVDNFGTNTLLSRLRVSSGDIVFVDPTNAYRTEAFSSAAPKLIETTQLALMPTAVVAISATGKVTGFSGTPTAGTGYTAKVTVAILPTVATDPGTGAAMDLLGVTFDAGRSHHGWTPATPPMTLLSEGSAYFQTLNNTPSGAQSVSQANPTVTPRTGQIISQNYEYRSGKRSVVIP